MVGLTVLEVAVDVPAGWVRTDPETAPSATLVARPSTWAGAFSPVLSVTESVPAVTARLADYADRLTAATLLSLGGHLIHVGTGHRPHDHVDLTLATEAWGVDVTVTQRYLRVGERGPAALATAVASDHDWPGVAAQLIAAVRSLRPLARPGAAP